MAEVIFRNVSKRFGATQVVDALNLTVADGELLGLLGPSGCGKSTLLRIVAGLLAPDTGEVLVDGELVSSATMVMPPDRRGMSMIFQSYALWPHRTVFDNVAFGLVIRKRPHDEIASRVGRMLDFVKMGAYADRYPSELSGGQQQRVALARSLVIEPRILLLDEPLSNLDASLREELRYEIRRFHSQLHITTIYVTHDQAEAMVTADRIAVLRGGRVEQVGSPEDIYERPNTRFVADFMGRSTELPGRVVDDATIDLGGHYLKTDVTHNRIFTKAAKVYVSIVPYAVQLSHVHEADPVGSDNAFEGKIVSQFYIGNAREYEVAIAGISSPLKASTPPWRRFSPGEAVRVTIPREHCWVIAG
jgi:iron(III) transport system ATP-binding protein